ncbi:maleylacetoacetate isomerase [Pigmentiphaga sp. H8]|uniref:maleylacetoacetate isomerase n=1 Tax=unclassified Pigmentiphaga TaxID=2626614 RepID=UPI000F5B753B|nr:maleylacetoacetate isomerase [Pigmentiphaga sp. H8]AZG09393.1 maleylacetoacetate isomerase [Pigmentiphaga sp. H8]
MLTLYTYWRSSTSYRVRIMLNWKGLPYRPEYVSLPRMDHRAAPFLGTNPQGLVPALQDGDFELAQSMAIFEYLEERHPSPALLPTDVRRRAYVRMLANIVACDIHPLNNVRVLRHLEQRLGLDEAARNDWYATWIAAGLQAFEASLEHWGWDGDYCCGDEPGLADVCLVPQLYNARRFGCDLRPYPRLAAIARRCESLPPFAAAHPSTQADAVA